MRFRNGDGAASGQNQNQPLRVPAQFPQEDELRLRQLDAVAVASGFRPHRVSLFTLQGRVQSEHGDHGFAFFGRRKGVIDSWSRRLQKGAAGAVDNAGAFVGRLSDSLDDRDNARTDTVVVADDGIDIRRGRTDHEHAFSVAREGKDPVVF